MDKRADIMTDKQTDGQDLNLSKGVNVNVHMYCVQDSAYYKKTDTFRFFVDEGVTP